MQIQINAPSETLTPEVTEWIETSVADTLAPHADRLTRVEVHLQDQNSQKGGVDKRCLIEARPRGMDPQVADHVDLTIRDACKGAIDKLYRVLDKRFGRLSARGRGENES